MWKKQFSVSLFGIDEEIQPEQYLKIPNSLCELEKPGGTG